MKKKKETKFQDSMIPRSNKCKPNPIQLKTIIIITILKEPEVQTLNMDKELITQTIAFYNNINNNRCKDF